MSAVNEIANYRKTSKKLYDISAPTCRILSMDPLIRDFLQWRNPLYCEISEQLVHSNATHLIVNNKSFDHYQVDDFNRFDCYYRKILRLDFNLVYLDNYKHFFDAVIQVDYNFVVVVCFLDHKQIYKDYFHFFVPRDEEPDKIDSRLLYKEADDGLHLDESGRKLSETLYKRFLNSEFNVLVFGINSLSRLGFKRNMPSTYKYLVKNLGAIEFWGYNKVNDKSSLNIYALLSGLKETEMEYGCLYKTTTYDSCVFIWNLYKAGGYATGFTEDLTRGGIFHYLANSFTEQPTDYYYSAFNYVEDHEPVFSSAIPKVCIGHRPSYVTILDYIYKLTQYTKDNNKKLFGIFWQSILTRDLVNPAPRVDRIYRDFFRKYFNLVKNDSIVFFLSDEGVPSRQLNNTIQGVFESNSPFLYMVLPEKFIRKHPEEVLTLKRNSRRLTTPFDVYETLKSIFYDDYTRNTVKASRQSLFQAIHRNRTCREAAIDANCCNCNFVYDVTFNITTLNSSAMFVVGQISKRIQSPVYNETCTELQFDRIVQYRSFIESGMLETVLRVIFDIKPGDGSFQATVKCISCAEDFRLMGSVTRIFKIIYNPCAKDKSVVDLCVCSGVSIVPK